MASTLLNLMHTSQSSLASSLCSIQHSLPFPFWNTLFFWVPELHILLIFLLALWLLLWQLALLCLTSNVGVPQGLVLGHLVFSLNLFMTSSALKRHSFSRLYSNSYSFGPALMATFLIFFIALLLGTINLTCPNLKLLIFLPKCVPSQMFCS